MPKEQYEIAFEIGGKLQASLPKSIFSAAGQLDRLGQKIATLEKSQGVSTRFRSLHNEIDATKLKLRQAEAELKKLDVEMRGTAAPTAAMTRNFEAAKGRVESLRGVFKSQVTELRSVKAAMEAAGVSVRNFSADNAKLAATLAKAQLAQKKMRENQGARAANKKDLEDARAGLGRATGRVIGAAAGVAAFVLPAKISADFEDSMARVGALSRATDGELIKLTGTARQLGRDTRYSATGAAEGMQYLAQAGFSTEKIISAMPGMLDLASAGAVDLGTSANISSGILKGFGMQAGETGHLGDVLTNTFTQSGTTLTDLGDTMKYVAPIAKVMGVSLETTAAAAGLLGDSQIKGEQAGTSMRAMLIRLAAPTNKAKDELNKLGVKTKDARGNLRPLADILSEMDKKMKKYGTATKEAAISNIFGMEAATAATVLLGHAGSGNLQRFTQAVAKSGTAAQIAAKQNATMKGQWDNIKGSVEDLAIAIGNMLIPVFKSLIDKLVPIVNGVTMWMQEHPKLTEAIILGTAALASLLLVLTVAGALFNAAKIAVLATKGAMLLLNAATWKAAAAWAAVNAPLLLAAVAIAGLGYAAYKLREAWNPVAQWFAELWDDALDGIGKYLQSIRTLGKVARFVPGLSAVSGVVDLIPDIGTNHRAERNRKFNEAAFNQIAPYSSLGGPMREDQRKPLWSMLEGVEPKPGSSKGDVTYSPTFAPQINLAPGAANNKGDVEKALSVAQKEFEKMMKGMTEKEGRLAYE